MEMARVWPVVCQFGVGAILCAIGVWAGLGSNYLELKLKEDRRLLAIIVLGFAGLLVLSCLFTFVLPFIPREMAQ